jgi:hypothetical protein
MAVLADRAAAADLQIQLLFQVQEVAELLGKETRVAEVLIARSMVQLAAAAARLQLVELLFPQAMWQAQGVLGQPHPLLVRHYITLAEAAAALTEETRAQ